MPTAHAHAMCEGINIQSTCEEEEEEYQVTPGNARAGVRAPTMEERDVRGEEDRHFKY